MTKRQSKDDAKTVRCAIYTRKSTEEGLDQEFNSLDAQRDSGEAFIGSQKHEGWVCLPQHYEDGGYTGGNMDRPALKRLLADIQAGKANGSVAASGHYRLGFALGTGAVGRLDALCVRLVHGAHRDLDD